MPKQESVSEPLTSGAPANANQWSAGQLKGLGVMGCGLVLLILAHLWTIAWAVQGRTEFEGVTRVGWPGGFGLGPAAPLLLPAAVLYALYEFVLSRSRPFARLQPADLAAPTVSLSQMLTAHAPALRGVLLAALFTLHLCGVGLGGAFLQPVQYDAWCANLSATWYGMPLTALAHLLGLGVVSALGGQIALRALGASWRTPARATRLCAGLALVSALLLGAAALLKLATGSSAPFVWV